MTKICKKCGKEKQLKEFTYRADRKAYRNECKECMSRDARIRRNGEDSNGFKPRSVNPDEIYTFEMEKVITLDKFNTKPRYCEYDGCKCLLHVNNLNKFCDSWCKEMSFIQRIPKKVCHNCGGAVNAYVNKKTGYRSAWRKLCDDCLEKRHLLSIEKKKALEIIKKRLLSVEKDPIGHLCKKCNTYKTWDKFGLLRGNKKTTCRECSLRVHNEWVAKNLVYSKERNKKYYLAKKEKMLINKGENGNIEANRCNV